MGHFYDTQGNPCHTLAGKNGKERPTTIADARKLNLGSGVTGITGQLDKPALTIWVKNTLLDSVLEYNTRYTIPEMDVQTDEEGHTRCVHTKETLSWKQIIQGIDSKKKENAPRSGTEIHRRLEAWYLGAPDSEQDTEIINIVNMIDSRFGLQEWIPEKTFYNPLGYGGSVDLHSVTGRVLLDFKTKDSKDKAKFKAYAEHKMQLAAYEKGLGVDFERYANVFISSQDLSIVEIVEHTKEDIEKHWKMFECLLQYYKLVNEV